MQVAVAGLTTNFFVTRGNRVGHVSGKKLTKRVQLLGSRSSHLHTNRHGRSKAQPVDTIIF